MPSNESLRPTDTKVLLQRLAQQSEGGWSELLAQVEQSLRILLHFRLTPPDRRLCDEDDLLQEVWLEARCHLNRFQYQGPGSLQRWMAAILLHKLSRLRRDPRRRTLRRSDIPETADTPGPNGLFTALEKSQPGVSKGAREAEMVEKVKIVLGQMEEGLREIILLRLYEGASGKEIAVRLKLDPSTVTRRYQKALDSCAVKLRELW